ncbi:FAD/NAD(P)-binding domain-containing protein [Hygrophoropsis aurantiaca]|uniref:FAD/NAD(P)-binding domain-containing protein n=1 Tax=Hygrophoropsis aurantiaca TaxID=72124 RepID=A0ACB8AGK6_9AGAM|nr:FAD/NAD(P)-binding domain-containing protein [Hygrophoropsis aurantiaca]
MDSQTKTMIPERTQILVIGGGPGGSYAATCLAREGFEVVLLEAAEFPRYHVGESMLASLRHFLRFIDLDEEFKDHGFTQKAYTDFISRDKENYSWNVIRSQADQLLFQHAGKCGARVFDGTKVLELGFLTSGDAVRPVSAKWENSKKLEKGEIHFEWLVDASGRQGVMSTKYLRNRKFNQSLKNIACWGYWSGTNVYSPETSRRGSPYFEALSDESGWAWFIPLHDGTTSVGIVMDQKISIAKKSQLPTGQNGLADHYRKELDQAPNVRKLVGEGVLQSGSAGSIMSASDYSYSATSYAGPNYRIIGDAAAFIDPYFSSGVHLALSSALSAAATICASIRGHCHESEASQWHTIRVGTSYTRFLFVVFSAYRQIRAQEKPVLTDIDEDNFDRAFNHFRPVIQGSADVNSGRIQGELKATLDFCSQAYSEPTSPEEREAVLSRVGDISTNDAAKFLSDKSPAAGPELDDKAKRVLGSILARKVMRTEDVEHLGHWVSDELLGYRLKLERNTLGLEKVEGSIA